VPSPSVMNNVLRSLCDIWLCCCPSPFLSPRRLHLLLAFV